MLYFASYFEVQHQHGLKIAISRSIPKDFKVDSKLQFLAPSPELLADWQEKRVDEAGYTQQYREQLKHSWDEVKAWLDRLDPKQHSTLLCWEAKNAFCHRNLVALLVQKHRSDCFGGCDVIRVEAELCPDCNSVLICGLDASYCQSCKRWWERPMFEKKLFSKGVKK